MEVTGRLESWSKDGRFNILWGRIYGDIRGRFRDGTLIHTSDIPDFKEVLLGEGQVVHTLNSHYLLGKPFEKETPNV